MKRVLHVVPGAGSAQSHDSDFNQEAEAEAEAMAQVVRFSEMSEKQQRAYLLGGIVDVPRLKRGIRRLFKMIEKMPDEGTD